MTYSIYYTASAERDIDNALDYIASNLKNPLAALRLQQLEQSLVNNLINFPYKHPYVYDPLLTPYEIRFVPIKSYLLFYTIIEETKTIYIVRFLYARSDWQHILQYTVQYDEYLSQNTGGYVHEEQEEYGKLFKKEVNLMPEIQNINIDNDNFDEEKARQELYDEIKKGLDDIATGRTVPADEVFAKLRKELED